MCHWLLQYQGFFFDFDGLLVDTEYLHFQSYQQMLRSKGFSLPWDFTTYCKYAHQETSVFSKAIYALFPLLHNLESNWMILREEKQTIYQELIVKGFAKAMPGAQKLLQYLKTHQKLCYVVSNCTKAQAAAIHHYLPFLDCIDEWITRESYASPKPSADGYLLALEKSKLKSQLTIGFEDSTKGLEALKKTPIRPILIVPSCYPEPPPHLVANITVFDSLEKLLPSSA